ncbi:hypothetical protein B0J18DRAFT_244277 [Chaetomium sp. MPI-SDFR-AT-0129]|nr:hypothetical protein B0J18DRAFT_244277 [Chaetomium sp. MPI-SDFR-AT-0129]
MADANRTARPSKAATASSTPKTATTSATSKTATTSATSKTATNSSTPKATTNSSTPKVTTNSSTPRVTTNSSTPKVTTNSSTSKATTNSSTAKTTAAPSTSGPSATSKSQSQAQSQQSQQSQPQAQSQQPELSPEEMQKFNQQQSVKDAWMQENWLRWSAVAHVDRTYVVVLDKSPAPVAAEVKRFFDSPDHKPNKTASVPRVAGLDEDIDDSKDLGNVMVGLVPAPVYTAAKDKFVMRSITVKISSGGGVGADGTGERTAYVPVGIKQAQASQGAPAAATPATGGKQASGNAASGKDRA